MVMINLEAKYIYNILIKIIFYNLNKLKKYNYTCGQKIANSTGKGTNITTGNLKYFKLRMYCQPI